MWLSTGVSSRVRLAGLVNATAAALRPAVSGVAHMSTNAGLRPQATATLFRHPKEPFLCPHLAQDKMRVSAGFQQLMQALDRVYVRAVDPSLPVQSSLQPVPEALAKPSKPKARVQPAPTSKVTLDMAEFERREEAAERLLANMSDDGAARALLMEHARAVVYHMSSIVKKRRLKMNKHKYRKRLKATRALRKSLNK